MEITKPWYTSLGMLAPAVSAVVLLLNNMLGLSIEESQVQFILSQSQVVINGLVAVVGTMLSMYGRARATSKVTLK